MDAIHLVTATNNAYAKPLAVMMKSLLVNKNSNYEIKIYIIISKLSTQNKLNFREILKDYQVEPIFIRIDGTKYSGYKETEYITKEMYYRISIPDLLDKNIEKALYLDCDIIVKEDISLLWNVNIDDYFVAAVESLLNSGNKRKKALSIPEPYGYFNSGVLLMNLYKWRKYEISNKVIEFINRNSQSLRYPDQDALNAILYDNWFKLEPKWNYGTKRHSLGLPITPAIIHYTGEKKPWNSDHPLKKEYLFYRKMIKWNKNKESKKGKDSSESKKRK